MSTETGIAWTDHTFNPWWGCEKISPGCKNCYAAAWDARFGGEHWGAQEPRRFFGDAHWREPEKWNSAAGKEGRRRRVFCASMADVFEDRRDLDAQRARLWQLIERTPHLDWQLLTKRPENIAEMVPAPWIPYPLGNVWLGTTVEDQQRADERIPALLSVPAHVRFLSCEPLLEAVDLREPVFKAWEDAAGMPLDRVRWRAANGGRDLNGIDWVIVGGESGSGARDMRLDWAQRIVNDCKEAGIAVFVKQLGAQPVEFITPLRIRDRKGGDPAEWPVALRVRQFPPQAAP